MRIFHVATAADWAAARQSGRYTTSTRGRSLAEEGFVHASHGDQWQAVRERFYADVTEPLVLLVIDTDRLTAPVVEEAVPDSDETFPHVYGAIEAGAVVRAIPLERTTAAPGRTFFSLYLEELSWRMGLAVLVIVVAVLVGLAVVDLAGDLAGLITMLVLLALGAVASALVLRRRERRIADKADSRP